MTVDAVKNIEDLAEFVADSPDSYLAARAVARGAPFIERVDLLVKLISHQLGMPNDEIDRTVQVVDQKLSEKIVIGGGGG